MKPSEVSTSLRAIASEISKSRKPSKTSVASDVRKVLSVLTVAAFLDGVKFLKTDIREYVPVGPDSSYPVIDGVFEFSLPDGRKCVFDGRLDQDDQEGSMTVDGEDVTDALWSGGDSASLEFLGLDTDLDDLLSRAAILDSDPGPNAEEHDIPGSHGGENFHSD